MKRIPISISAWDLFSSWLLGHSHLQQQLFLFTCFLGMNYVFYFGAWSLKVSIIYCIRLWDSVFRRNPCHSVPFAKTKQLQSSTEELFYENSKRYFGKYQFDDNHTMVIFTTVFNKLFFQNLAQQTSEPSFKRVGLFLHGFLVILLTSPLALSTLPLSGHNIDPTYLYVRNVSFFSPHWKMMLRITAIFLSTFHTTIVLFSCALEIANAIITLNISLKLIINSNLNPHYVASMKRYRQLQIINSIFNHVFDYVISIGLLISSVCGIIMGYILIKLTGTVPHNIIFAATSVTCMMLGLADWLVPMMAELDSNSREFVRSWKLKRFSAYAKKQLRSCRQLNVNVGEFFNMTKESRTEVYERVIYYMMSLVISVWFLNMNNKWLEFDPTWYCIKK